MKESFFFTRRLCVLAYFFVVFFLAANLTAQAPWRAVNPVELDVKTPKVEADADAEVIFWEAV
jgi:hypothetical protein